jgi:hypothetical protein
MATEQGEAGNVFTALSCFVVPGLGQLIQRRFLMAAIMLVAGVGLWFVLLGWVVNIWSVLDAYIYRQPPEPLVSDEVACSDEVEVAIKSEAKP